MPIENDFTRVYGAIKELEERVERLEGWPKTTKPAEHVEDFLDSAVLSRDLELAEQEICALERENHQLKADAKAHLGHLNLVGGVARSASEGIVEALAQNNQLRFVLSILAAVKDDGWIEWYGGRVPPVLDDVAVDVRFRSGETNTYRNPSYLRWSNTSSATDIIAYRIAR